MNLEEFIRNPIGVILLAVLTLLLVATIIALIRALLQEYVYQKSERIRQLGDLQFSLDSIERDIGEIEHASTQEYSLDDPVPYGPMVQRLQNQLGQARAKHADCVNRKKNLAKQKFIRPKGRLAQMVVSNFLGEPLYWRERHKRFEELNESIKSLASKELNKVKNLLTELRNLPITTLNWTQKLQKTNTQTAQLIQELYDSGLHGSTIDSAKEQAGQQANRLKDLPPCFLQNSSQLVMQQARKEDVVLAWQELSLLDSPINEQRQLIKKLQSQHQRVGKRLQEAQQIVKEAQIRCGEIAPSIDTSAISSELAKVVSDSEQLQIKYRSSTVEGLIQLEQQIPYVLENGNVIIKEATTLIQQYIRLDKSITDNTELLAKIAHDMEDAAHTTRYPLLWQQSQETLDRSNQLMTNIGDIQKQRTPAQLETHVKLSVRLETDAKNLHNTVSFVRKQRDELIQILDEIGPATSQDWFQNAENLHRDVGEYDPENWPVEDNVRNFLNEAKTLYKRQQILLPKGTDEAVPENKIHEMLADLKDFKADFRSFQKRLQGIGNRLSELQKKEQSSSEKLELVCRIIDSLKLASIVSLSSSPNVNYHQKKEGLRTRGYHLRAELTQRGNGRISDKANSIDNFVLRCEQFLRDDLQRALQTEFDLVKRNLGYDVKKLQDIAPFDREEAMSKAKKYLAVEYSLDVPVISSLSRHPLEESALGVDKLIHELECLHQTSEEIISQGRLIYSKNENLENERMNASVAIKKLKSDKNTLETGWPPVTFNLDIIDMHWESAEKDRNELHNTGYSFDNVYQGLVRIAGKYDDIRFQVAEIRREIENQLKTLQDIENRIEHWRTKLRKYLQNPEMQDAVKERLNHIEEGLEEILRQHRSQPLRYDQAERRLTELWDRAKQDIRAGVSQNIIIKTIEAGRDVIIKPRIEI